MAQLNWGTLQAQLSLVSAPLNRSHELSMPCDFGKKLGCEILGGITFLLSKPKQYTSRLDLNQEAQKCI